MTSINLNHSTGDFTQYSGTNLNGTDMSVAAAAALAGTNYGMSCLVDDATLMNAYKELNWVTGVFRFRLYIDPNALAMSDGSDILAYYACNSLWDIFQTIRLIKTGSAYQIKCVYYWDTSAAAGYSTISDAEHYVEVEIIRATTSISADGSVQWWVDGGSIATYSGLDNYHKFDEVQNVYLGKTAITGTVTGTYYLDELVVNDDGSLIGPVNTSTPKTFEGGVAPSGILSSLLVGSNSTVITMTPY